MQSLYYNWTRPLTLHQPTRPAYLLYQSDNPAIKIHFVQSHNDHGRSQGREWRLGGTITPK